VKLGRNASDSYAMLSEAYGGEALKKLFFFFEWHSRFKECRENVEDDEMVIDVLTEPIKVLKKYGI
jgi:hypothetical protein